MRDRLRAVARTAREVLGETMRAAGEHAVAMMAAAMAFWLLLAIAPFALLISMAGQLLGAAQTGTDTGPVALFGTLTGDTAALAASAGGWPAVAVLVVVVYSAAAFFTQFAYALQRIWGRSGRGAMRQFARRHVLGFVLVGALAAALFASVLAGMVASALVAELRAIAEAAGVETPGILTLLFGRLGIDFMAATLLYLAAFTLVPSQRNRPRDVLPGALVTGASFAIGQIVLSWYLTETSRVTLAGSMGSLISLLLWVYYTSLISLYGAELTRVIAQRRLQAREGSA